MKKTYRGSCHCFKTRAWLAAVPQSDIRGRAIHHRFCRICGVRPFSPVRYFDMLHDDPKSPPAEMRHL